MRHEDFKEHERVFEEGDFGDKFYIVLSGRVTVYKGVPTEIGTSIQVSQSLLNTLNSGA